MRFVIISEDFVYQWKSIIIIISFSIYFRLNSQLVAKNHPLERIYMDDAREKMKILNNFSHDMFNTTL